MLCETVKDFVARVGKAYEKATESSEESEVMARKVKFENMFGLLLLKCKTGLWFSENWDSSSSVSTIRNELPRRVSSTQMLFFFM